ncbi:hypothetical protein [Psychroserpens mesophilus]|uniref:hypothetical protein n=1 Tax=Psychroserpens mesophilus TaxID=325473 RepID=UPI0005913BEC|nr:hypothetical protein [Psychroserpens mesophilus]
MENFINTYELDFVKDIPTEFKKVEAKNDSLKQTNFLLVVTLSFIIGLGGLAAYYNYYDSKKKISSFKEIDNT